MAEKRKTGTSFYVEPPATVTGRTITIVPTTIKVVNEVTGDEEAIGTSSVSGSDNEFYSGNYDAGAVTPILSAELNTTDGYYFEKIPGLTIKNEGLVNGRFITDIDIVSSNELGAKSVRIILSFQAGEDRFIIQRGFPTITFDAPVVAEAADTQLITSYTTATKISNIAQKVSVPVFGDEGSAFKVTCTGSDGTSDIGDDAVKTISITNNLLSEEISFSDQVASSLVLLSIPAKTSDVTWTITIVPESGTTLASGLSTLTLLQQGLRTITFTDDTTGLTNTTFTDNITTLTPNYETSSRWVERQAKNINDLYKENTEQIEILINASSGVVTLKDTTPNPTVSSSFTNIKSNGITLSNIRTEQTTTTRVTLRFNMKVPVITANISSAIKLSDFLTN
tara:strand:- start:159 stop:1343 length:1185 start_codon:yes stop_codon:yes gene_type:complete